MNLTSVKFLKYLNLFMGETTTKNLELTAKLTAILFVRQQERK